MIIRYTSNATGFEYALIVGEVQDVDNVQKITKNGVSMKVFSFYIVTESIWKKVSHGYEKVIVKCLIYEGNRKFETINRGECLILVGKFMEGVRTPKGDEVFTVKMMVKESSLPKGDKFIDFGLPKDKLKKKKMIGDAYLNKKRREISTGLAKQKDVDDKYGF